MKHWPIPPDPPGRDMVARCFPGGKEGMRAEGFEPPRAVKLRGFSYRLRLSPSLLQSVSKVCGLDYPFTVPRIAPGVRCCPSSLYTFPAEKLRPGLARDCHVKGFPEFGQFYFASFPASTQVLLKSAASAVSATPACGTPDDRGGNYRRQSGNLQRRRRRPGMADARSVTAIPWASATRRRPTALLGSTAVEALSDERILQALPKVDLESLWSCPRPANTSDVGVSPRGGCSNGEAGGGDEGTPATTAIVHGRVQGGGRHVGAAA